MEPNWASEDLRKMTVWLPLFRLDGVVTDVPDSSGIYVVLPSMINSALFAPLKASMPMVADFPEKVNETPVADQLNSLVAGLTRPR